MRVQRRKKHLKRLLTNRQREFLVIIGVTILAVALLLTVLVLVLRLEYLRVGQVKVTGAATLDEGQLSEEVSTFLDSSYYFILPKNNRFLIPKRAIHTYLINTYPKIRSVESNVAGDTYKITATERSPHSLWCGHTRNMNTDYAPDCYFADATGFIFARAPYLADTSFYKIYGRPANSEERTKTDVALSLDADTVYSERALEFNMVGTQYVQSDLYKKLMQFIEILNSEGIESHALEIQDAEARLYLSSGGILRFRIDQNLDTSIGDIVLAYNTKKENGSDMSQVEYIDVRFTNKILFKFVNTPEAVLDEE